MKSKPLVIVLLSVCGVALVLWYFLGRGQGPTVTVGADGVQHAKIIVQGGYEPELIVVKQGQPVRLAIYRDETASCSNQIRIEDFGIVRDLPAHQTTTVEFTPDKAGEFLFTCGMRMMQGKLVVEAG